MVPGPGSGPRFTAAVTTPIVHDDEDAEETDPSTLAGDFDPEDGDTSDEEEAQK